MGVQDYPGTGHSSKHERPVPHMACSAWAESQPETAWRWPEPCLRPKDCRVAPSTRYRSLPPACLQLSSCDATLPSLVLVMKKRRTVLMRMPTSDRANTPKARSAKFPGEISPVHLSGEERAPDQTTRSGQRTLSLDSYMYRSVTEPSRSPRLNLTSSLSGPSSYVVQTAQYACTMYCLKGKIAWQATRRSPSMYAPILRSRTGF